MFPKPGVKPIANSTCEDVMPFFRALVASWISMGLENYYYVYSTLTILVNLPLAKSKRLQIYG